MIFKEQFLNPKQVLGVVRFQQKKSKKYTQNEGKRKN